MHYLEALSIAHKILEPDFYLEIGCREGRSLSLATCRSLAIDPEFEIRYTLKSPTQIFSQKSVDFFNRPDLWQLLRERPDLSFIDGMHLVEYVLRDFINLEKCSKRSSVILIDDVLPREIEWTKRIRESQYWTGDVYRVIPILRNYRPDLQVEIFDVDNKGLAVISNLDPSNHLLLSQLDLILTDLMKGKFMMSSSYEIRQSLNPRPVELLEEHLKNIKQRYPFTAKNLQQNCQIRYLDLLKKSLLNELYLDNELRITYLKQCLNQGDPYSSEVLHNITEHLSGTFNELKSSKYEGYFLNRSIENVGYSHTMMGSLRLNNLHQCLDHIRLKQVPGDFIECGVWRGGGCIFMAGYLKTYAMQNRNIYVADSFDGLPDPTMPQDMGIDLSKKKVPELAICIDTVKQNFSNYDLFDDNVHFLKGWFKDTLMNSIMGKLALLRLDGDYYESTMDILIALYDKVTTGGIIIVDDYALQPCREAVTDFFAERGEQIPQFETIDWTGIWWFKH